MGLCVRDQMLQFLHSVGTIKSDALAKEENYLNK